MQSETQQIIDNLKNSDLYAECSCGDEFKLSDVILFDGTKPFPPEVMEIQEKYNEELRKRGEKLAKDMLSNTDALLNRTRGINLGMSLEKVLPIMNNFRWQIPDCRFLGKPIDMITFNGLSENKIESISFVEIKSGFSKLTKSQKLVKDAVEDQRVEYKVF